MKLLIALFGLSLVSAQTVSDLALHGVKADAATHKDKSCVRLQETGPSGAAETIAILKDSSFQNGTIEMEVASTLGPGAATAARGFIGLAFRVQPDAKTYEAFYLRPTNARADDQVRRNHSLQYISHPDYTWARLRKESPEKYESYADMVPGEWTPVKIVVQGATARLYVNNAAQPNLIVNDLKQGDVSGALALWIGPGTVGHFRGLKVTK